MKHFLTGIGVGCLLALIVWVSLTPAILLPSSYATPPKATARFLVGAADSERQNVTCPFAYLITDRQTGKVYLLVEKTITEVDP
jgi:hypothetical protein